MRKIQLNKQKMTIIKIDYLIVWKRDLDHLVGVAPLAGANYHGRRAPTSAVGHRSPVRGLVDLW